MTTEKNDYAVRHLGGCLERAPPDLVFPTASS
jgi:hypothetical protein